MSQNAPSNIPKIHLQGHQAPVLCLDHSSSLRLDGRSGHDQMPIDGCLLSGSEDGTARLWDLRANHLRAAMCLIVGTEVLSVAFGPPLPTPCTMAANSSLYARNYCV
jgi:WD40 repeat protein